MRHLKFISAICLITIIFTFLTVNSSPLSADNHITEQILVPEGSSVRYAGPFTNTTNGLGGAVIIDLNVEPTTVSGYINFTDGPDVAGVLCGAGSFSGSRSGNNFSFSFTSNDPEPGCAPYNGITYNISGRISGRELLNGSFSVPSLGQEGIFSAKQTIRSSGEFINDNFSLGGDVDLDLAVWSSTIAGYINFTGEPDLCGANSFTGTRSGNNLAFSFRSSDLDGPECDIVDDERFNLTATLSSNSLQNGTYYLPDFGQGGTFWTDGPPADSTAPTGNISSPSNGATIGNGHITISANASDNNNGTGVGYVEFWVKYDGSWHFISTDPTPPYTARWTPPAGLKSQKIRFAIDIGDKTGNVRENAGGYIVVRFIESNGSDVQENWVPSEKRAYLNQRSLPDGNVKCGAASVAMVLAMNNKIGRDYNSMANTANDIYVPLNPFWQLVNDLRDRGMAVNTTGCVNIDVAWETIKNEIDAGYPVIILNSRFTIGHYFVIVGYRQDGDSRQIIAYDPYGKWAGTYNHYDINTTSPDSTKGRWVFYDFEQTWGTGFNCGLILARPSQTLVEQTSIPTVWNLTDPDEISSEPVNIQLYEGEEILTRSYVYLPLITRP